MIKASAHPTLENFTFKGATDKRFLNGFYRYIRSKVITDLHIFIPPQQFQNTVEDIKKALYLFGIDLGYDLTPRILFLNRLVIAMFEELVKRSHLSYKDILRKAQVDLLTGSQNTLSLISRFLGKDFIEVLSSSEESKKYDVIFNLNFLRSE